MSPRYSTKRSDRIEYSYWLVFDAGGGMRFSRGEPTVGRDERAMSCTATLPRSLFNTPRLKATIAITEGGDSAFTVDIEAATDALRGALGVDIDLRVTTSGEQP